MVASELKVSWYMFETVCTVPKCNIPTSRMVAKVCLSIDIEL